jgi:hypothetical protein
VGGIVVIGFGFIQIASRFQGNLMSKPAWLPAHFCRERGQILAEQEHGGHLSCMDCEDQVEHGWTAGRTPGGRGLARARVALGAVSLVSVARWLGAVGPAKDAALAAQRMKSGATAPARPKRAAVDCGRELKARGQPPN